MKNIGYRFATLSLLPVLAAGAQARNLARPQSPSGASSTAAGAAVALPDVSARRVPIAPGRVVKTYAIGGFALRSQAAAALAEAESGLRRAGETVVASRVTRQSSFPFDHGFAIDYLDHPGCALRRLKAYQGGTFAFESQTIQAMESTKANLEAAGSIVIAGAVSRQKSFPFHYSYRVDFIKRANGRQRPGFPRDTAAVDARLDVRVTPEKGSPRQATLVCAGGRATGTGYLEPAHAADAACKLVLSAAGGKRLVEGPPRDQMCTQIYGGPQKAAVTGTVRGRQLDTTFSRTDGCRIADWKAFEALLGRPD